MDKDDGGWCTLESDPAVFTEVLKEMGVRGIQVDEIYSLDEASFAPLEPIFGLIFLFKWRPDPVEPEAPIPSIRSIVGSKHDPQLQIDSDVFFASQVINNACGTQALLSVVMNIEKDEDNDVFDLGGPLTTFLDFTKDFTPNLRGLAITNSETLRLAHNSFASPQHVVVEKEKKAETDDDLYHFISYIPKSGKIYELDGLKPGPVVVGEGTASNWVSTVIPIIQKRIDEYSVGEIRFCLMALSRSKRDMLTYELSQVEERITMLSESEDPGAESEIERLHESSLAIRRKLEMESSKLLRWRKENNRRKFNYTPFIIELLKLLASKGELNKMIQELQGDGHHPNPSPLHPPPPPPPPST